MPLPPTPLPAVAPPPSIKVLPVFQRRSSRRSLLKQDVEHRLLHPLGQKPLREEPYNAGARPHHSARLVGRANADLVKQVFHLRCFRRQLFYCREAKRPPLQQLRARLRAARNGGWQREGKRQKLLSWAPRTASPTATPTTAAAGSTRITRHRRSSPSSCTNWGKRSSVGGFSIPLLRSPSPQVRGLHCAHGTADPKGSICTGRAEFHWGCFRGSRFDQRLEGRLESSYVRPVLRLPSGTGRDGMVWRGTGWGGVGRDGVRWGEVG